VNINKLYIPATNQTPEINFNPTAVIFEISGVCILTQPETFFSPIIDWLINELPKLEIEVTFVFQLEYFNTASSKFILDIMSLLEDNQRLIKWIDEDGSEIDNIFG